MRTRQLFALRNGIQAGLFFGLLLQFALFFLFVGLDFLVTGLATTLIAGPWLVAMINATRALRIGVLVGTLAAVLLGVLVASKRMPTHAVAVDDD